MLPASALIKLGRMAESMEASGSFAPRYSCSVQRRIQYVPAENVGHQRSTNPPGRKQSAQDERCEVLGSNAAILRQHGGRPRSVRVLFLRFLTEGLRHLKVLLRNSRQ